MNLHKFFHDLQNESYAIMKYAGIDEYIPGSDIDIFVQDIQSVVKKIVASGNEYLDHGYEINVIDNLEKHSYVDFRRNNKIEFRFDIYEHFKMYNNAFIEERYLTQLLNHRKQLEASFEGKEYTVSVLGSEDELVLRYLEYADWHKKRPDKIKHIEYILKELKVNPSIISFLKILREYTSVIPPDEKQIQEWVREQNIRSFSEHIRNNCAEKRTTETENVLHHNDATMQKCVCIIFSKDRPLQLDGTLRSLYARCQDSSHFSVKVLYRASEDCQPLYDELIRDYPLTKFISEKDFRKDLLDLIDGSENVMFAVDDNLFIRDFTLAEVIKSLQQQKHALGFSLRLGHNTTYCYPLNAAQTLPTFNTITGRVMAFDWTKGEGDFNYPMEVSSSVYRTSVLLPLLQKIQFKNPNTLEGELAACTTLLTERPQLLCFEQSHAFCNPVNMVQSICKNRTGGLAEYSPEKLAQLFREGKRLNVEAYKNMTPTGCHQDVPLYFNQSSIPLVSIIIPCYKQAKYLPEAVQSVVNQTFTDWELIIVNDGSPDETITVARELTVRHPEKNIVLVSKPNGGLADARNAGIRAAKGKYILPLDADDIISAGFLQETVTVLNEQPEISVAYTDLQCFEGSNEVIPKGEFATNLLLENRVAYCSLYRREVWDVVGGYNPNMSVGYEDWDFWAGAIEHGFHGQRIPKNLLLYRVRNGSMVTAAIQHHHSLFARIILNHPRAYDEKSVSRAEKLLHDHPLPAPRSKKLRISVIIPCYNQAHYLPESVKSVAEQTDTDWEIIIVNDGSPDDTNAVAADLMRQYPGRITLLEKTNGGLPSARNAGIRAAQGEYIFLLDADDRIQPTMLEKTKAVLAKNPRVGFAYTEIQHFGAMTSIFALPDFDRATLIAKDNIVCGNCLVRKSAWQQAGGYNELMREGYEDWDFWIGCVEKGWDGYCIHEPLFCYRKSSQSMLGQANQKRERLIATIICNHPKLYDDKTVALAEKTLNKPSLSVPKNTVAHPAAVPLRITYLISSILGVTGGNQTLLKQCNAMVRKGHSVTIITYSGKPVFMQVLANVLTVPAGEPMSKYVPVSDVVVGTYFLNARELKNISATVKIYFAQGDQFVFEDSSAALSAAQKKQLQEWKQLSKESYCQTDVKFIANSRNLAGAVENKYGRTADAIVPVCIDQTIFRPLQRSLLHAKPRILIVGPDMKGSAMEPLTFKGIGDIRAAMEMLKAKGVDVTAVRMSNSAPEIFKDFPCEFYAVPSDELKTFLYGTATILVYASHYDSCPIPPLEAMAAGAAVVCTATAGAKEYCRNEENCLLVPIQSPGELCNAIERLLNDKQLRDTVIRGGFETAKQFPREREWNEMEKLFSAYVRERRVNTGIATHSADKKNLDEIHACLAKKQYAEIFLLTYALPPDTKQAFNEEVLILHGCAYLGMADLAKAQSSFEQALAVNPGSSDACSGLGEVFYRAEMDAESKTMFEWAVVNDGENIAARKGLAKINKVLQLRSSDNSLLAPQIDDAIGRAEELINCGEIDQAREILNEVIKADLYHIDALNDLSVCSIIDNNVQKAAEIISLILAIDPDNEIALENIALIEQQSVETSVS